MKLKIIDKGKSHLKVEFVDVDEAFLYLITQQLLSDKRVVTAKYTIEHPMVSGSVLYVEVSNGSPKTAIKRAVTTIKKEFELALEGLQDVK